MSSKQSIPGLIVIEANMRELFVFSFTCLVRACPLVKKIKFTFCDEQTLTNMVTDGILLTLVTDGTNGQTTNMVTDRILLPLVTDGTIYFL